MKKQYAPLITVTLLITILISCQSQNNDENKNDSLITISEAVKIIKEYNISEGSIKLKRDVSENEKSIQLKKSIDSSQTFGMTESDFRKVLEDLEKYQQSPKGKLATRINNFFRDNKGKKLREKQVDSFYKVVDKEFGTDISSIRKPKDTVGVTIINKKHD